MSINIYYSLNGCLSPKFDVENVSVKFKFGTDKKIDYIKLYN